MFAEALRRYRTLRQYGAFADSPTDRLRSLLFRLFAGSELPNIILGGAISASISAYTGSAPLAMPALAWAIWAVSVVNFMLAQEWIVAYRAAQQEFAGPPRGIY